MSSVLADFTARFNVEAGEIDAPVQGRIVLGKRQLVLAASGDQKVTIPLSSVIDISPRSVPQVFDPIPGTPVSVAFRQNGAHAVALVAADESVIEKFSTVLFKAILNGTRATIKHPAKLGGRVLDTDFRGGLLSAESGTVRIETEDGPVVVSLDTVTDFSRETHTVGGQDRPVLVVDHMHNGDAKTTIVATESTRTLSILGRLLRREYEKHMADLRELSLSETDTEVLTTIYSTRDRDISLANVLGIEPEKVKHHLHSLHQVDLIESGAHGPVLTSKGQVVVNHYLERVNK
ncbi:CheF family chemotaxis protein [Haloarcula sp. Atlit-7R]|uniref:CheF family chemotaxis protein n=1 Tax=Haloarcula sp. Atlit-7R TaxID=2282125 RepID=UPI000EF16893|nr:CheF family chemotaxis protein [Haloarcula sp. Atlit-7R]RLM88034.1 hypothetical protein D3D01_22085 [Haloarcula sp. Atlit-7R]